MKKKGLNVNDAVTVVRSVPLPEKSPDPVSSATSPAASGATDSSNTATPHTNQNTK